MGYGDNFALELSACTQRAFKMYLISYLVSNLIYCITYNLYGYLGSRTIYLPVVVKIGDINDGVFLWNDFVLVNHFYQEFFAVEAILLDDKFLEVFHLKHSRTFEVAFIAIVLTFPRMYKYKST